MRSLLFVPGDSPRKQQKGLESGADALIIDLEDSVALDAKPQARKITHDFLRAARELPTRPLLIVRINALTTGLSDADLDAVMPGAPDAIMLPKSEGGIDIGHLAAKIAVREAEADLPDGATRILPIATETGKGVFGLGTYGRSSHRLMALTWGAEDLSADLGAETNRLEDGAYTDPYRLARSLTLFGASAAQVDAIDTVFTNFRDDAAFRAECRAARRDGFTGKMAIHPAQVGPINEIFAPSAEALAKAQRVIALFAANPGAGVIGCDGEMLDRPHLRQAERLVARARKLDE
ncbi:MULTISPECIES: CoA ester lyase [unclassified Bosea (in: a-proteobacteria)]|uniref:HpcH/HpaI aldolase/citrate lyase family protein n=1 Tax=unclassified Bosea (in: a-proteobacteria) TaxID=2653178 RepID=UPI000953C207|nr:MULTISPECIES: CoA ester lyase [unclassified Bosea (in: a-proteobacteria)]TAJ31693.1 MAG: CoA ester lyase [Bosea sp. (in: a-proteobacteria)]SIQ77699.1 citrate lyase subunit beta / citryl-CoA lyase [Bosea sp. TND4EK4]